MLMAMICRLQAHEPTLDLFASKTSRRMTCAEPGILGVSPRFVKGAKAVKWSQMADAEERRSHASAGDMTHYHGIHDPEGGEGLR